MKIQKAIDKIENTYEYEGYVERTEAWQTLKNAVLAAQANNTRSLKLPGVNMVETVIINQHEGASIEQRAKIAAIVRETYEYLAEQLQASA